MAADGDTIGFWRDWDSCHGAVAAEVRAPGGGRDPSCGSDAPRWQEKVTWTTFESEMHKGLGPVKGGTSCGHDTAVENYMPYERLVMGGTWGTCRYAVMLFTSLLIAKKLRAARIAELCFPATGCHHTN